MAYSKTWDETVPADNRQASLGDDDIRDLKFAIRERMETIVNDWDTEDPLVLLASAVTGAAVIQTGLLSARPNPPTSAGIAYYAHDTDQLFVSIASGATFVWEEPLGAAASLIGSPAVRKSTYASYDPDAGAGTRASAFVDFPYVLYLDATYDVAMSASLDFEVDFDEFGSHDGQVFAAALCLQAFGTGHIDGTDEFLYVRNFTITAGNILTFHVYDDAGNNTAGSALTVVMRLMLLFPTINNA